VPKITWLRYNLWERLCQKLLIFAIPFVTTFETTFEKGCAKNNMVTISKGIFGYTFSKGIL
jgi:hypothetical protein